MWPRARGLRLVSAATALLEGSWQSGSVAVSGGHLAYHRTGGARHPLVLVHGLTDNGLCWSRTAAALRDHFDIIMLDARGHGESVRMAAGEADDPARDLAQAIAALGLEAPIVMGHSIGAMAVAGLAAAYPALVSQVILEDPPFLPMLDPAAAQQWKQQFQQQVAQFQSMTAAEISEKGRKESPAWHDDEFAAWALSKHQVDPASLPSRLTPWQEIAADIAAPTLLIYGEAERGGLVSQATAAEAMRLNPQIKAVQIEGAGHNIRRENFAGFLVRLRSFLALYDD